MNFQGAAWTIPTGNQKSSTFPGMSYLKKKKKNLDSLLKPRLPLMQVGNLRWPRMDVGSGWGVILGIGSWFQY